MVPDAVIGPPDTVRKEGIAIWTLVTVPVPLAAAVCATHFVPSHERTLPASPGARVVRLVSAVLPPIVPST